MHYTTIYFDLDGTIFDFHKSEKTAIKSVLKLNGLPYDDETALLYSSVNQSFWEKFEKGEIKKEEIFTGRFIELLKILGAEGNPEKISSDYFEALSHGHDLIDGAVELLKRVKETGYYSCATTNGVSKTQYKRIDESGIGRYFDYICVSEDAKHQKPEKEYFDYVISNTPEKDRRKILIIGDSQTSDILGGVNSNIDTCFYNPKGIKPVYESRYTVSSLYDILDILLPNCRLK